MAFNTRSIPVDFAKMAKSLNVTALTRHYRASRKTIIRFAETLGIEPTKRTSQRKDAPPDFATLAPSMSKKAMGIHFNACQHTINRWVAEHGVTPKAQVRQGMKLAGHKCPIPRPRRETDYDLAAEYLRRFGPVSRCDVRGKYSLNGDHFMVGSTVMTFKQVIERAEKHKARKS